MNNKHLVEWCASHVWMVNDGCIKACFNKNTSMVQLLHDNGNIETNERREETNEDISDSYFHTVANTHAQ